MFEVLRRLAVPFLLMLSLSAPARAAEDIVDPVVVDIAARARADDIGRAVKAALHGRGWDVTKDMPGHVEARLEKPDSYYVAIDLDYTATRVKIRYIDSEGLGYDEEDRSIHGNYNKWLRILSKDILKFVDLLASGLDQNVTPAEKPAQVVPVLPAPVAAAPVAAPPAAPTAAAPSAPAVPAALNKGGYATLKGAARLRARPAASADAISKMPSGALLLKAEVANAEGRWWYLESSTASGWAQAQDLLPAAAPAP